MAPHRSCRQMIALARAFLAGSSGAAMVEFALVLPVLLMMFLGMIAWGYTLTVTDNMYDAARQAARQIAVGAATAAEAQAAATAMLSAWPATFTIVAEDTDSTGTDDVRVTISIDNVMTDMISVVPTLPSLNASVTMRKEE